MLEITQGGGDRIRSDKLSGAPPRLRPEARGIVPIISVCPVGRAATPPLYTEGQWAQCLVQNAQGLEW